MDLQKIKLDHLADNIFSEVAKEAADFISPSIERGRTDVNKSTQLRKFYDELMMWHDKVLFAKDQDRQAAYVQVAPFIQMLKAKAAYSLGRKYVNENFVKVFNQIISQINSPDTLKHAKLFFEAVLAFRKASEQK